MKQRFAIALAALLTSCASSARLTGNFDEYRVYRQARLAPTLEERLGASDRYLHEYPRGDYRSEVKQWFGPAEDHYFRLAWDNLPRLRAYLDAMPRGPHAEAVADRISQLESRTVYAERREQRMLDRAQTFEERLARAAERRRAFVQEFSSLLRGVAYSRSFGQPTSELDSDLLLRFRVRHPAGHCEADRCSKILSLGYAVPDAQGLVERNVEIAIELTLERGLVQSISFSAPELLVRVAEAAKVQVVAATPQARAEAVGQALEIARDAIASALPEQTCPAEAVSPVVLARRCEGVDFQVLAGTEAGAPDRVVARRDSGPPPRRKKR